MKFYWNDWMAAVLGAWLAVSPHALGYTLDGPATENAYGAGVVVVLFNVISACRFIDQGQELFNILLGVWLVLSPYSLGFRDDTPASGNAIAVGALVVALAVWSMAWPPKQESS